MLRAFLGSVGVLFLMASLVTADDKTNQDKNANKDKHQQATITKVDRKNHTVTVRMKDKNGKEVTKDFKLAEDIRMLDEKGNVAAIDVFQSGNDVLVVEREGKLVEMKKHNPKDKNLKEKNTNPNPIKSGTTNNKGS